MCDKLVMIFSGVYNVMLAAAPLLHKTLSSSLRKNMEFCGGGANVMTCNTTTTIKYTFFAGVLYIFTTKKDEERSVVVMIVRKPILSLYSQKT